MRITGNKGEWSELYAFIKLLSLGKLYAADKNVNLIPDIYFPILKILREENPNEKLEYVINRDTGNIEIIKNQVKVGNLSKETLIHISKYFYTNILSGSNRAFEIEKAPDLMEQLQIHRISAPSSDKTDISMQIHDTFTGFHPIRGFSIKSELGHPPTLLNASRATNFIYEVKGLTDADIKNINNINTTTKIIDRINVISSIGYLKFYKVKSPSFSSNLQLVDTQMEQIIAIMLLDFFQNGVNDCKELIKRIETSNPLQFSKKGFYDYKFKRFLYSVALGMMPSKDWDGQDEANGGYVIVKQNGDVVAYHIYNRNAFESYLLDNTKFEKASTTKHDFASLYKDSNNNNIYINLNLQIRFK